MIVYNQLFVYKTYVVNHWKVLCYMHCWGMQVIDMLISRIWLKVDDDDDNDDFQSIEPAQRVHGLKKVEILTKSKEFIQTFLNLNFMK